jgi:hypothetical protein
LGRISTGKLRIGAILLALLMSLALLAILALRDSKAGSSITVDTTHDPGTSSECSLRAANNANDKTSDANSTCAPGSNT